MRGDRSTSRVTSGFTLIELIVVIVLMGILAAMIIPEMRGTYGDAVLRAGGRELADVCSIASSRAVSFNQVHRVHVDPATRRFRVERRVRGLDRVPMFVPLKDVSGSEGQLSEHVTVRIQPASDTSEPGLSESTSPAGSDVDGSREPGRETDPGSGESAERVPSQGLSFYPDGTADRGEILLRDSEGFGLVLRINPVTARVRVVDLPRR